MVGTAVADSLIFVGLVSLLIGLVSLVRPLAFLRVRSRKAAVRVVGAGFVLMLLGGLLAGPRVDTQDGTGDLSGLSSAGTSVSTADAVRLTTVPAQDGATTRPVEPSSSTPAVSTGSGIVSTTSPVGTIGPTVSAPTSDTTTASGEGETATVVGVVDGDTLRVSIGGTVEKLRLIGINTPESGECYADEATVRMIGLVDGQTAQLVSDVSNRDQYGRLLRYVYVDGVFVNEVMVREGFAIARRYEPDTAMADLLDAAQAEALAKRVGLWAPDACGPALTAALLRIEQVMYDAPGDDSQNLNGEWVAIGNVGDTPVDLSGWVLKDESASHRYYFPSGFVLLADGSVTVHSGCGADTHATLYWCVSGSAIWNNSGDTAFLLDSSGNIVDIWSYPSDETTARAATSTTTTTVAVPTTTATVSSTSIRIITIHYDACGNDVECYNDSEYVELANSASETVDLSGWSITDAKDHTISIPSGYLILAGGRFRIYAGDGDNDTTSRYFDGRTQAIWNNTGGDTATLRDNTGEIIDTYNY